MTSASFVLAKSPTLPSYFLVSSWISSLRGRVVLGEVLVLFGLVGRLVAVAADVADGDLGLLGQFPDRGPTILRRTSVDSGGTFRRITRPSLCGLKPRSLAWMAFSMSLSVPGS